MTETNQPTALITGASRGIGRAVAIRLAADGFAVALNFASRATEAEAVRDLIQRAHGSAELLPFDVADSTSVETAVGAWLQRVGRCDVLVNNAGIARDGLLMRTPEADWEQMLAVNLGGAFHCCKVLSRQMLRARYGRIVNIASVIGQMGNAGQAAYAATKAGLVGFTKSLARELASRNITVNAVAPGFIDTDMVARLPEAVRSEYLKLIPVGRLGATEEVADAVAFLARPEAGYITGQVLAVNGGLYM